MEMDSATLAVLFITAAFVGFCIWIERHSRNRGDAPEPSEPSAIRNEHSTNRETSREIPETQKQKHTSSQLTGVR